MPQHKLKFSEATHLPKMEMITSVKPGSSYVDPGSIITIDQGPSHFRREATVADCWVGKAEEIPPEMLASPNLYIDNKARNNPGAIVTVTSFEMR